MPKARIAEAIAEAVSAEASAGLAKLKKGEAVAKAERSWPGRVGCQRHSPAAEATTPGIEPGTVLLYC